jgi:hypothetical protein
MTWFLWVDVFLQYLAEQLQLTCGVRRVRDLRINLCATLQNWFHVLKDSHSGFSVVTAHAAFADSTKW